MKKIKSDDTSYKTFQDILTGYRLTNILKVAHESNLFDLIGKNRLSGQIICEQTGWHEEKGLRFLEALCGMGLLDKKACDYSLSLFSQKFLLKTSENYQGNSLAFEECLIESWHFLNDTLKRGQRVYATEDKTKENYEKALDLYLGAMDDAAKIRAGELWDLVKPEEKGVILDAGAGSGAFLTAFLKRHTKWKGIFCDLKDVIKKAKKRPEIKALDDRIDFIDTNLMEKDGISLKKNAVKAKILILSNFLHCQGKVETKTILSTILDRVDENAIVIIHDFFSDCGWRGAVYDIHMMLNTYNGRTYTIDEMLSMLADFEFVFTKKIQLASGSTLLVASKKTVSLVIVR